MLRNKEEKKEMVKGEAHYAEKIEELRARTKGIYLVVKGETKEMELTRYG